MSSEVTDSIKRMFETCFNTGDMSLADELIAADYVDHSTMAAPAPGVEGFKARIAGLRKTFPDARFTVEDIFADGDKIAFRWTVTGTDLGGFMGRPPTGNAIDILGVNIEWMANGKIVEHWSSPDNVTMLRQLGMMP